ncbi:MAG: CoA transferase [Candidatus Andeanibacterium colombiense]|uniref:CoA transferase n=1 Tax=Candidatus Andeanibacterium colombiense TaxID=3121345 RepID=A0AAJ6BMP9_9SPHN|nr:MAG: CoA transferase [Sphingomonadaceae bacterium]
MGTEALKGIVVLDLTRVLAGPMCTQYLADLGARVIKVEPLGLGDETRGWPPFGPDGSAVFANFNRNKKSIAVDLKSAEGQAVLHRLAQRADVVIENFGYGVAQRLGVDEPTLRALNQRLVYCSIGGFGAGGPLSKLPAYDVVLQAFTGMMELTGDVGSGPIRSPYSPNDYVTGLHAVIGILAALRRRDQDGVGERVDVSLFDTAMGLLSYQIESYWASGKLPQKNGSSHPSMCPYQALDAADGPMLLAVSNDSQWQRFCDAAGAPELKTDPRFATNAQRVANRPETLAAVQELLKTRTGEEWMLLLGQNRVPCSPILNLDGVLAHPQTTNRDVIRTYRSADGDERQAITVPVKFDGQERSVGRRPPALGEDTATLLSETGLSADEIASLQERHIVG